MIRWTSDRVAVLVHMNSIGASVDQIAERLNGSSKAVIAHMQKIGLAAERKILNADFAWNPDNIELTIKLYKEGASASAIGRRIGCSRNAVIGKIHRLGLAGTMSRAKPVRKPVNALTRMAFAKSPPKPKKPVSPMAALRAEPLPERQETDVARKSLIDLETGDCRFPVGEPGQAGFGFCAAPTALELKYCHHHALRCYQPPARPTKTFVIYDRPFTVEKQKVEA